MGRRLVDCCADVRDSLEERRRDRALGHDPRPHPDGCRRHGPRARRSSSSTVARTPRSAAIRQVVGEDRFLRESCNLPVSGGSSLVEHPLVPRRRARRLGSATAMFGHCNTYIAHADDGPVGHRPVHDLDHRAVQHGPQRPHLERGRPRTRRHSADRAAAADALATIPVGPILPASPTSSVSPRLRGPVRRQRRDPRRAVRRDHRARRHQHHQRHLRHRQRVHRPPDRLGRLQHPLPRRSRVAG